MLNHFSTGDVDYLPVNRLLNFLPGEPTGSQRCFLITILDDGLVEQPETFMLSLRVGDNTAIKTVTILDGKVHEYSKSKTCIKIIITKGCRNGRGTIRCRYSSIQAKWGS